MYPGENLICHYLIIGSQMPEKRNQSYAVYMSARMIADSNERPFRNHIPDIVERIASHTGRFRETYTTFEPDILQYS